MKAAMIICVLILQNCLAQDSISLVFMKEYNQYRHEKNLNPLQYAHELDSISLIRLTESAAGIDDCFELENKRPGTCSDGIRNPHFKFEKTKKAYNADSNLFTIISENMAVCGEFMIGKNIVKRKQKSQGTLASLLNILFPTAQNEVSDTIYYQAEKVVLNNLEKKMLDMWISSPKHNAFLLDREITHFSYKIYRTLHSGRPWTHAIFLGAVKKE